MRQIFRKIFRAGPFVLICILITAPVGAPAVFINSIYGYLPLLLLASLVLFSVGSLHWLSRRLEVVYAPGTDIQCERGQSVDIGLKLVNKSRLACVKANACIEICDLFGLRDETREVAFAISGKAAVDFNFGAQMPHIGCYTLGLSSIVLYDFLGLFRKTLPVSGQFSVVVTPRIRPLEELQLDEDAAAEASAETKISVVGGSEYTGVRGYELGDPMKQIHWKISARTQNYMTKIQESYRQQEFSVVLDFAALELENREQLMDINDCLIETALSVLEEISRHDAGGVLLYCDRGQRITHMLVSGRETDAELVYSFSVITPNPGSTYPDACMILREEAQAQNHSGNIIVVTCRPTAQLLQELVRIKQQHRLPMLYLVVSSQWSSRMVEAYQAPLRVLDDANVPYFIISSS